MLEYDLFAADALKERALVLNSTVAWFRAGDAYFASFRRPAGERRDYSIREAIFCYEEVLNIDPEELKAKTSLGVCYVEGARLLGSAPMKGIGMLKQVLEADPENIQALVNLGYFSIQSGQYDKALERFNKVLENQPGIS